jgi:O-glycosyl hydrolase
VHNADANYIFKGVQTFKDHGVPIYMVGIQVRSSSQNQRQILSLLQNEPENDNPTYPSTKMSSDDMGQVGNELRSLLDKNNLKDLKIIGYEHNWVRCALPTTPSLSLIRYLSQDDATAYASDLVWTVRFHPNRTADRVTSDDQV